MLSICVFFFHNIENENAIDDHNQKILVRAFGDGLRQAQIGIQASFSVDVTAAPNFNEDVKVLVTSKKNSIQ